MLPQFQENLLFLVYGELGECVASSYAWDKRTTPPDSSGHGAPRGHAIPQCPSAALYL